jgi:MerR family transcriptional regulator/heat shock protein HspR
MRPSDADPFQTISVASRLLGLHVNTLRKYERHGLISPSRSSGNQRLFSAEDLTRLRQIKHLVEDRGVNLAGVGVALTVTDRMLALRQAYCVERTIAQEEVRRAIDGMLSALGADPHEDVSPGSALMEDTDERKRTRAELKPGPAVESK